MTEHIMPLNNLTKPLRANAIAMGIETVWSADDWASAIVWAIEEQLTGVAQRETERPKLVTLAETITLDQLRKVGQRAAAMGRGSTIGEMLSTILGELRRVADREPFSTAFR